MNFADCVSSITTNGVRQLPVAAPASGPGPISVEVREGKLVYVGEADSPTERWSFHRRRRTGFARRRSTPPARLFGKRRTRGAA